MKLVVAFLDESVTVGPDAELTFGRAADLVIDEANVHLHRHVGRFAWTEGMWWLENLGRSSVLTVTSTDGTGYEILPSSRGPLWFGPCTVHFRAGRAAYQLQCCTAQPTSVTSPTPSPRGEVTVDLSDLPLTVDQRRLVACLAEQHLVDPGLRHTDGWVLPTNRQAALRLQWPITTFNRKLDRLCARFSRRGVPGVGDDPGLRADDRRARLVQFAVLSRLITPSDLALINGPTIDAATDRSASDA